MKTANTDHSAPVYDHALVMSAREFALLAHGAQMYGSQPYISHLDATVRLLMRLKASSAVLAAGYLHDVMEDCEHVRLEDLQSKFGDEIVELVSACTGIGSDRAARMQNKASKIAQAPGAARVAFADRYCNMRSCAEDGPVSMQRRYARELPLFLPIFLTIDRKFTLEMMAWANQAVPGVFDQLN